MNIYETKAKKKDEMIEKKLSTSINRIVDVLCESHRFVSFQVEDDLKAALETIKKVLKNHQEAMESRWK